MARSLLRNRGRRASLVDRSWALDLPPIAVAPRVRTRITPLSPARYTLEVTLPGETHDLLRGVQGLLGHAVPSGDVAQVLHRALLFYKHALEKRKFGVNARARHPRTSATQRCTPTRTRHAVYERDEGRCVFVDNKGQSCGSTSRLEFDHIQPVARGGKSTIENLRLLCRAHNQFEAERAFGMKFIQEKSTAGRRALSKGTGIG